jgi:hypothetical protein
MGSNHELCHHTDDVTTLKGSHLYYTTVEVYNKMNPTRSHTAPMDRPMALTKYADANMHPGEVQHQHPAHHRYPVWWTGDGVDLEASVESMVDSGVYDFKPYVYGARVSPAVCTVGCHGVACL